MRVNGNSIFDRNRKSQPIGLIPSLRSSHAIERVEEQDLVKKNPVEDRLVYRRAQNSFSLLEEKYMICDDAFSQGIKLALTSKPQLKAKMDEEVPLKAGFDLKIKLRKEANTRSIQDMEYVLYDLQPFISKGETVLPLAWCKQRDLCYLGSGTKVGYFMEDKNRDRSIVTEYSVLAIASLRKNYYAVSDTSNHILVRDLQKDVTHRRIYCNKTFYTESINSLSSPESPDRCTELVAGLMKRFEVYDLSQKLPCVTSKKILPCFNVLKDVRYFGDNGISTLDIQHVLSFWDRRKLDVPVSKADCLYPHFLTQKYAFNPNDCRYCAILTPNSELVLYDVNSNKVMNQVSLEESLIDLTWHTNGKISVFHGSPFPGISIWKNNSKHQLEQLESQVTACETSTTISKGCGHVKGDRVATIGDFHFDSPFESIPNVGFLRV